MAAPAGTGAARPAASPPGERKILSSAHLFEDMNAPGTKPPAPASPPKIPQSSQRRASSSTAPVQMPQSYDPDKVVMPRLDDPKLWCVKVFGDGVELCNTLMTKLAYKQNEDPNYQPPIFSAFASDHIKNYMYVEAYKEADLRTFLQGVRGVSAWDTRLVPEKEMGNVLRQGVGQALTNPVENIKAGQFVRILAQGHYKGDLARVLKVSQNEIAVRLKPRVTLGDSANMTMRNFKFKSQSQFRPKADFLSYDIAARHPEIQLDHHDLEQFQIRCYVWNETYYTRDSGHVIKVFAHSKLDPNVRVTFSDQQAFSNIKYPEDYAVTGEEAGALGLMGGDVTNRPFKQGEKIRVTSGQLRGVIATVHKILENGNLMVQPALESLGTGMVIVDPALCEKHFVKGQRIKVTKGPKIGIVGTVCSDVTQQGTVSIAELGSVAGEWPPVHEAKVNDCEVTFESAKPTFNDDDAAAKAAEMMSGGLPVGAKVSFKSGPELTVLRGVVTAILGDRVRVLDSKGNEAIHLPGHLTLEAGPFNPDPRVKPHWKQTEFFATDKRGEEIGVGSSISLQPKGVSAGFVPEATVHFVEVDTVYARDANKVFYCCDPSNCILLEKAEWQKRAASAAGTSSSSSSALALLGGNEATTSAMSLAALIPVKSSKNGAANKLAASLASLQLTDGDDSKNTLPKPPARWHYLGTVPGEKKYKGMRMRIIRSTALAPYKGQFCEFRQYVDADKIRVALSIKAKMVVLEKANVIIVDQKMSDELASIDCNAIQKYVIGLGTRIRDEAALRPQITGAGAQLWQLMADEYPSIVPHIPKQKKEKYAIADASASLDNDASSKTAVAIEDKKPENKAAVSSGDVIANKVFASLSSELGLSSTKLPGLTLIDPANTKSTALVGATVNGKADSKQYAPSALGASGVDLSGVDGDAVIEDLAFDPTFGLEDVMEGDDDGDGATSSIIEVGARSNVGANDYWSTRGHAGGYADSYSNSYNKNYNAGPPTGGGAAATGTTSGGGAQEQSGGAAAADGGGNWWDTPADQSWNNTSSANNWGGASGTGGGQNYTSEEWKEWAIKKYNQEVE
ncbi:unnamed protein product [Amoebophrya sp. A25]|nr:unnamed protein product [Amoebophrya sp. A25]|eukprot:GSA25T00003322001.1